jgi:hypothetical protein
MNTNDLRELKKLKDEGILTEEEFQQKKKEFLENKETTKEPNFKFDSLKSLLGISSLVFFVSMFFPFLQEFGGSINGWRVASDTDILFGPVVFILYLIPIGSAVILFQLVTNGRVKGFTRIFGLVPFIFTILLYFKIRGDIGDMGSYNSQARSYLVEMFKEFIGFGLIISYVSGLIICFHKNKPKESSQTKTSISTDPSIKENKKNEEPFVVRCVKCGTKLRESESILFLGKYYCERDYLLEIN